MAEKRKWARLGTVEERFWQKVDKESQAPCWVWEGGKKPFGHGKFHSGGVTYIAHRWAKEQELGEPIGDLLVCHQCDNPACVNPSHLFLGTHQDNVKDMLSKGRGSKGETSGLSPFKEEDILEIRNMYDDGVSQKAIAREYGVTKNCIHLIVHRQRWAHV